jgi:hypothetical protein
MIMSKAIYGKMRETISRFDKVHENATDSRLHLLCLFHPLVYLVRAPTLTL